MANNYFEPVNDHFNFDKPNYKLEDVDDVDDDIFLSNSRASSATGRSTNPFEDLQQSFAEKRREIESRTLDSTQKSLSLLYETEEVGKATALELAKQREQLENTSRHLDEINSTLRFSQRHLTNLKSVFGGLKNYLSGNRDTQSPRSTASPSGSQSENLSGASEACAGAASTAKFTSPPMSPTERYDSHPISRIRDDSSAYRQREQVQQERRNNPFDAQLEANLDEMCGNLSRLKGLAVDLGSEIESQNELLDNMSYKMEDVDIKLNKQTRDMNKLMGNK